MTTTRKRTTNRRASFKELRDSARGDCAERLSEKAHRANQIAKVATDAGSRRAAYGVKSAALQQGIRSLGFRLLGDEQARPTLAIVRTPSHGMLHIRTWELADDIADRPDVSLRLRGSVA